MNVPSVSAATAQIGIVHPPAPKAAEAAQQFEGILLRQFLSESMKPLLQGGEGGQIYGYLLTDTLTNSMVKAGGLGLSSILQAQFSK